MQWFLLFHVFQQKNAESTVLAVPSFAETIACSCAWRQLSFDAFKYIYICFLIFWQVEQYLEEMSPSCLTIDISLIAVTIDLIDMLTFL